MGLVPCPALVLTDELSLAGDCCHQLREHGVYLLADRVQLAVYVLQDGFQDRGDGLADNPADAW